MADNGSKGREERHGVRGCIGKKSILKEGYDETGK